MQSGEDLQGKFPGCEKLHLDQFSSLAAKRACVMENTGKLSISSKVFPCAGTRGRTMMILIYLVGLVSEILWNFAKFLEFSCRFDVSFMNEKRKEKKKKDRYVRNDSEAVQ